MSQLPTELKYTKSHEWVRVEGDVAYVGITDHAQDALGDIVYVELPDVGTELHSSDEAGVIESVKAASDVYAPISGEVIAINEDLEDAPETVNRDPYHDGWFYQLKISDASELDYLLDAEGYKVSVEVEE